MSEYTTQPTDTFRWITRDHLQRMYITIIGVEYIADKPAHEDHVPVWTQDESVKGRVWRPAKAEWRDETETILQ